MARGHLFIATAIVFIALFEFHSGECKTIKHSSEASSVVGEGRKLENFVEFTGEGDQLAVESTGAVSKLEKERTKNEDSLSATGRECPNVQKALYPVIPVIIAFLVAIIGAIIISAIIKLVVSIKSGSNDESSEYGVPGYSRRVGKKTLFGFDLSNISFAKLARNVLTAIEKVY